MVMDGFEGFEATSKK